jgi:hypothetical protein
VAVLSSAATVALAMSALGAGAASVTASWQMNETARPTMVDSSGLGLNGVIGSNVAIARATSDGGLAYGFSGDRGVVTDERLVTVPDDSQLDPGTGTYAVTVRMRTAKPNNNMLQKGQSGQTGGYWKLQMHDGWPICLFRDSAGNSRAIGFVNSSDPNTKVNDSTWHTLRCERTATGVNMTIDYGSPTAITKTINGTVGNIDNTRPLSIGGKLDCNGTTVGCDYFSGSIDWVSIERP